MRTLSKFVKLPNDCLCTIISFFDSLMDTANLLSVNKADVYNLFETPYNKWCLKYMTLHLPINHPPSAPYWLKYIFNVAVLHNVDYDVLPVLNSFENITAIDARSRLITANYLVGRKLDRFKLLIDGDGQYDELLKHTDACSIKIVSFRDSNFSMDVLRSPLIRSLHLNVTTLREDDVMAFVGKTPCLEELFVNKFIKFTEASISALAKHSSIKKLYIAADGLSVSNMEQFIDNSVLTHLDLSIQFFAAIYRNKDLEHCDIKKNNTLVYMNLSHHVLSKLNIPISMLVAFTNIRKLMVQDCGLQEKDVCYLENFFSKNKHFVHLNTLDNYYKKVCFSLQHLTRVKHLSIAGLQSHAGWNENMDNVSMTASNLRADIVSKYIDLIHSAGIGRNMYLRKIELTYLNLNDFCAGKIAESKCIWYADLSNNKITAGGAMNLAGNKVLKVLILKNNNIGDNGALHFARNDTLDELDLRDNNIKMESTVLSFKNRKLKLLIDPVK